MLYMIKERDLEPAPGPGEKSKWIALLEGDALTMSFSLPGHPEIILPVSHLGRMKMKKSFGVNFQWCIFYDEEGIHKEYKKEYTWVALCLLFCPA